MSNLTMTKFTEGLEGMMQLDEVLQNAITTETEDGDESVHILQGK